MDKNMICDVLGIRNMDSLTKFREILKIVLLLLFFHACLGER